jgi:hypothetical protein
MATDPGAAPDLNDDAELAGRLLQVMRSATGRGGLAYAGPPQRLQGGFWATLLAFTLAEPPPGWPHQLVARVMPEPGPARKESVVQAALAADGFPTPAVRLWGGQEDAAPPAPDVVCHGDLHPFNLLADGRRVTVLDWSVAMLAPRAFDLAFTSLMLSDLPLTVPAAVRAALRPAGRAASLRFMRRYQHHARVRVDAAEVRWYQAVVSLRALTEVAGWVHEGTVGQRPGHPWLTLGSVLAARLGAVTGIPVRAR